MDKSIRVFARETNSIQVFTRKSNSLYRFIVSVYEKDYSASQWINLYKSPRERVIRCIDLYRCLRDFLLMNRYILCLHERDVLFMNRYILCLHEID
jgi:hypothetical protein